MDLFYWFRRKRKNKKKQNVKDTTQQRNNVLDSNGNNYCDDSPAITPIVFPLDLLKIDDEPLPIIEQTPYIPPVEVDSGFSRSSFETDSGHSSSSYDSHSSYDSGSSDCGGSDCGGGCDWLRIRHDFFRIRSNKSSPDR